MKQLWYWTTSMKKTAYKHIMFNFNVNITLFVMCEVACCINVCKGSVSLVLRSISWFGNPTSPDVLPQHLGIGIFLQIVNLIMFCYISIPKYCDPVVKNTIHVYSKQIKIPILYWKSNNIATSQKTVQLALKATSL